MLPAYVSGAASVNGSPAYVAACFRPPLFRAPPNRPPPRGRFEGPASALAFSNSTAAASVNVAGSAIFGNDAFTSPSVTYGP